ncbi:MAG: maa [Actinomycetia bacterium]|nr:maa [Actinomycetes bacterium]
MLADLLQRAWRFAERRGVITRTSKTGRRFRSMGEGAWMAWPPGDLVGPQHIELGRNVFIGAQVLLAAGMPAETLPPERSPVITIGDRTTIGRGSMINGRIGIHLDHDVTIAPNVYITDHNHTYGDVETPIGRQFLEEAPVRIGPGCWLATNVVILPGTTLGRHVTVAAGAVVGGDIPDHSVVAGIPGKVIRRWTEEGGWDPPMRNPFEPIEGWPRGYPEG